MQFGFRAKHPCVHAIVSITDYMRDEIDKRNSGQACFLALKKAFDSLDHTVLMNKLYSYGFRGPIQELIEDYLSNRWQLVEVNRKKTECQQIKTGVPQGSILGLFLFSFTSTIWQFMLKIITTLLSLLTTPQFSNQENSDTSLQADLDKIADQPEKFGINEDFKGLMTILFNMQSHLLDAAISKIEAEEEPR